MESCTIHIEVMSKNINAKRLYEKMGFVENKKNKLSPFVISKFGYPIILKRSKDK